MGIFDGLFGRADRMPEALTSWVNRHLGRGYIDDFEFLYRKYGFAKQPLFTSPNVNSRMFPEQLSVYLNNVGFELVRHGKARDAQKAFDLSVEVCENESGLMMLAMMQAENGDGNARSTAARYLKYVEDECSRHKTKTEEYVDSINPYSKEDEDDDAYQLMKQLAETGRLEHDNE